MPIRLAVDTLCGVQQKSLKVSREVYEDLKAYARARGGLPLGRAIETLLASAKQGRPQARALVDDESSLQTKASDGA